MSDDKDKGREDYLIHQQAIAIIAQLTGDEARDDAVIERVQFLRNHKNFQPDKNGPRKPNDYGRD